MCAPLFIRQLAITTHNDENCAPILKTSSRRFPAFWKHVKIFKLALHTAFCFCLISHVNSRLSCLQRDKVLSSYRTDHSALVLTSAAVELRRRVANNFRIASVAVKRPRRERNCMLRTRTCQSATTPTPYAHDEANEPTRIVFIFTFVSHVRV